MDLEGCSTIVGSGQVSRGRAVLSFACRTLEMLYRDTGTLAGAGRAAGDKQIHPSLSRLSLCLSDNPVTDDRADY